MARLFVFLSLVVGLLGAAHGVAAAEPARGTTVLFTQAAAGSEFLSRATTAVRTNALLVLYDGNGAPVARYYLENAWPSKVELGSLDAAKNEVSIESLEISSEGIVTDIKDPDGAYVTNGITGTVSFAGRQSRGALFPLR
jgi:hypothetical protein